MRRLIVAASLLVALQAPAFADCVVKDMNPTRVRELIDAAPSCEQGLKIFQGCGWGATSDVMTADHVITKCEAVFEGKLSGAQRRSYGRTQKACDRKYAGETGSEGRSLTAFCRAETAARLAKQFSKTRTAPPAKK
jgi:hypothetical protein